MTERIRITRVAAGKTQAGKDIADLYSHDTRLEYPVLRLFDLSSLTTVGIDPADLTAEMVHCNFWAVYELSEKLTTKGNPYKDVIALERIDSPATTTSTDTTAVLGELRAIKALLLQLVAEQATAVATVDTNAAARIQKLNSVQPHTNTAADPQATDPEPEPEAELSEADARTEFYALTGPAIAEHRIKAQAVNDLVRQANGEGWNRALALLKEQLT